MRLDAFLANAGLGTRSQVKEYLKQKRVTVDHVMVKDYGYQLNESKQVVEVDGKVVEYKKYRYYLLNKPAGYITATEDKKDKTVMDLLDISNKKDYFPIGRLDKDTEGLLVITNDGELSHNLLSPKKHVMKAYYAKVEGNVTNEHIELFKDGIIIDEGYKCLPAELEILINGAISEINIKIVEGKFHQVKRMFEAIGSEVVYLKRIAMGGLKLTDDLKLGEYKELSEEEVKKLSDR